MSRNIDMTAGKLHKQIFAFSLPLILSNILQVLFNMADVAVVGRFAGKEALGSVGSTTILIVMFTGFLIGIGSGVNALTALFVGAKSEKDVEETVHTSFAISLIIGIILSLIGVFGAELFLRLLNTKDELFEGALLYVRIYFWGMPALAVYNFGNGVYSAIGNTKRPLAILSLSGVLNVILNLIFVINFGKGVAGVAWASVISQYLSAILIMLSLLNCRESYGFSFSKLHLDMGKAKRMLALGVPAGCQNAIFQFANLFIQRGVNSFDAIVVEGNSAAANSDGLVYTVMASFYTACTSFMSQNYGAKKKERVLKSFYWSMLYSFLAGAILGILLVICGKRFLCIFATDPNVLDAGMRRLKVMGFSYMISAFMDCTIAASRGLGRTGMPTLIVFLGSCVFRVIWVYTVFEYFHTIESLYLLYVFSWTITAIAEIWYFVKEWKIIKQEFAG